MIKLMIKSLSLDLIKNHPISFMLIWATFGLVGGSFLLYFLFLIIGSFTIVDLHLSEQKALLFDAFLSILFFLQHSLLIRREIRQKLTHFISNEYYSAFYGITSGIALLLVMVFWQKSSSSIVAADGLYYWMFRALFFLSLAGFYWGVKSLGSFEPFGIQPILLHITKRQINPQPLAVKGPYRWVRHPLYFFMMILIWSCPVLTLDRLLFNILWCVWIVIATNLEDRDLFQEYGNQYHEYQMQVPMLIPYRIPRTTPLL
jgi:protein-S-isoprenylcysteine O-methyltransferase Ste14